MLEEGITVSETTAGRILRELEDKGYVRAEGRVGRAITSSGKEILEEWRKAEAQKQNSYCFSRKPGRLRISRN